MKRFLALLLLLTANFFLQSCENKQKETPTAEYVEIQGFVHHIDVDFDMVRNKKINVSVYLVQTEKITKSITFRNSDFVCRVGDPVLVMYNPKDSNNVWIAGKKIVDPKTLKAFLIQNELRLSSFFARQLE
uniref:hypothetical protein n=1 Tax=Flavobacterium sp. TaxID=239 RepID=UPI00404A1B8D